MHNRRFEPFQHARLRSNVGDKNAKTGQLLARRFGDFGFSALEFGALLLRPSSAMPDLVAHAVLHFVHRENVVITRAIFARVFARSLQNGAARQARRVNQISVFIFKSLQIKSGLPGQSRQIVFVLKAGPTERPYL